MSRDLSHQHQIVSSTDEIGQAGMAQDMGRELQVSINTYAADDQIDGAGRKSLPFVVEKECWIGGVRELFGALLEPGSERLAHLDIQWHFAVGIALARADDHHPA